MAQGFMTNISSGGSTPTTFAYDKRRLDRLVNSFMFMGFGEEKSLAGNMGVSISFRRYDNLVAATTALPEGQNNGGSTVTKDTPPGQLTVARGRQATIAGWKRPVKQKKG